MKKVLQISLRNLLFSLCFLFSACSLFNVPVKEYLKEYTEEAKIVSHEISVGTVLDKNGMPCVSSNQDCVITYTLRNPQQYDLRFGIDYSLLTEDQKTAIGVLIPVADRAIAKSGTSSFSLTYPIDFLTKCDCGEYDISPTITLTEPKSGRSFESYSFNLKSNSPPPVITSPVMYHTGTEGDDRYVLYFNLPGTTDMSTGLSRDLKTLAIGNKSFDISNTNGQISISDSDSKLTVLTTSASTTGTTVNPNITFTPSTNLQTAQSIRFETSQIVSDSETTFAITLTDEGGLTSTTVMSNKAVKIADPIFTINGTTLVAGSYTQNNDSYCTIRIAPPATSEGKTTSDATVDYNITRWNGVGTESDSSYTTYITGKGAGGANVNLSPGKYKISAYAYKSGFADSDTETVTGVIVTAGKVYVDETDTGSKGYGTKAEPCTNVQDAVNLVFGACVSSTSSTTATISVLSNVTYASGMTAGSNGFIDVIYNGSSDFCLTIDGSDAPGGNAKIDANGSSGLGKRVMYVKKGSTGKLNLTLSGLTLTGGYTTTDNGGGIYNGANLIVTGGSVIGDKSKATYATSGDYANYAVNGGGIYGAAGSETTIEGNSYVAHNYVTNVGGGLAIDTYSNNAESVKLTIESGSIQYNTCVWSTEGYTGSGGGGVYARGNAVFNMTGGSISYNSACGSVCWGGGVCLTHDENNTSTVPTFTMSGGDISNNIAYQSGGGVAAVFTSKFILKGGTIDSNISGGTLNTAVTFGGGIYIDEGSLTISEESSTVKITNNSANSYGGGICLNNSDSTMPLASVTMSAGTVSGNSAEKGGGVAVVSIVNSDESELGGETKFTMSGGVIGDSTAITAATAVEYSNTATYGGGVYAGRKSYFVMNQGKIMKNYAVTDGGGVRSAGGNFTMGLTSADNAACMISYNLAKHGGGVHNTKGYFTMNSGTISYNHCYGSTSTGGGLWVSNDAVSLKGGLITNNSLETGDSTGIYLKGDYITMSGSINVDKSNHIVLCEIDGKNTNIKVDSSFTGSATITPSRYDDGTTLLSSVSTQALCDKFTVTPTATAGYCVFLSGTTGILKEAGLSALQIEDVEFTPNVTKVYIPENNTTVPTGYTLSLLSVLAKDSFGSNVVLSNSNMTSRSIGLYQDGFAISTSTVTSDSEACKISLAGLYIGTYQLKMSAVISGTVYSKQVDFEVKYPNTTVTFTSGADATNTTALRTAISAAPIDGSEYCIALSGNATLTTGINAPGESNITIIPVGAVEIKKSADNTILAAWGDNLTLGSPTASASDTLTFNGTGIETRIPVLAVCNGTMSIYQNVTIQNENQTDTGSNGNIVVGDNNDTILNLFGCTIKNNFTYTGSDASSVITLNANAIVNMYSGTTITGNTAKYVVYFSSTAAKFNWYGGSISNNSETSTVFSNDAYVNNQSGNTAN